MFQSVCPLMPFLSAYHLTWVSLTLDVGYLFTAAPAKHSHCLLPWTWGSSSVAASPDLRGGVDPLGHRPWPWTWGSSSRLLLHRRSCRSCTMARPPDLPLEKLVCRSGSNSWNWPWNNRLVPNRKRSMSRLYVVTMLILLICRVRQVKYQAGWSTIWNQDCWEKYK